MNLTQEMIAAIYRDALRAWASAYMKDVPMSLI